MNKEKITTSGILLGPHSKMARAAFVKPSAAKGAVQYLFICFASARAHAFIKVYCTTNFFFDLN